MGYLQDKSTAELIKKRDLELQQDFPSLSKEERLNLLWSQQLSNRVTLKGSKSEWIVSPNMLSRFAGFLPLTNIKYRTSTVLTGPASIILTGCR